MDKTFREANKRVARDLGYMKDILSTPLPMSKIPERTIQTITDEMKSLPYVSNDIEAIHGIADDLLCEALHLLGCEELVGAFKTMDLWYA